ncbi:titin-like [Mytilus edulis]
MYMCIAEKYGKPTKQVRHEIHLNVRPVKPEFLKKLVDTAVDSGELINLEAEVRPSESVTSVTWQHEGEDVISSNGKKKLLCREGKLILKISNATGKDSGKYSCIVKSKGMSSHEEESISYCHVTVHSALSSAIENVLGDEQVIEGRAPMNHIIHVMHDPNAVYQ